MQQGTRINISKDPVFQEYLARQQPPKELTVNSESLKAFLKSQGIDEASNLLLHPPKVEPTEFIGPGQPYQPSILENILGKLGVDKDVFNTLDDNAKAEALIRRMAQQSGKSLAEYRYSPEFVEQASKQFIETASFGLAPAIQESLTGSRGFEPTSFSGKFGHALGSLAGMIAGPFRTAESGAKAVLDTTRGITGWLIKRGGLNPEPWLANIPKALPQATRDMGIVQRVVKDSIKQSVILGLGTSLTSTGQALQQISFTDAAKTMAVNGAYGTLNGIAFGLSKGMLPGEGSETLARLAGGLMLMNATDAVINKRNPFLDRPVEDVMLDIMMDAFFLIKGLPKGRISGVSDKIDGLNERKLSVQQALDMVRQIPQGPQQEIAQGKIDVEMKAIDKEAEDLHGEMAADLKAQQSSDESLEPFIDRRYDKVLADESSIRDAMDRVLGLDKSSQDSVLNNLLLLSQVDSQIEDIIFKDAKIPEVLEESYKMIMNDLQNNLGISDDLLISEIAKRVSESSAPHFENIKLDVGKNLRQIDRAKNGRTVATHGTDIDRLESILANGLEEGTSLDLTYQREWAREFPVQLEIENPKIGTYVDHNDYYKAAKGNRISKVTIDLDQYTDEGAQKAWDEAVRLQNLYPDIQWEISGQPPRPNALTTKNIAKLYAEKFSVPEDEALKYAVEDWTYDDEIRRSYTKQTGKPIRNIKDYEDYMNWLVDQGTETKKELEGGVLPDRRLLNEQTRKAIKEGKEPPPLTDDEKESYGQIYEDHMAAVKGKSLREQSEILERILSVNDIDPYRWNQFVSWYHKENNLGTVVQSKADQGNIVNFVKPPEGMSRERLDYMVDLWQELQTSLIGKTRSDMENTLISILQERGIPAGEWNRFADWAVKNIDYVTKSIGGGSRPDLNAPATPDNILRQWTKVWGVKEGTARAAMTDYENEIPGYIQKTGKTIGTIQDYIDFLNWVEDKREHEKIDAAEDKIDRMRELKQFVEEPNRITEEEMTLFDKAYGEFLDQTKKFSLANKTMALDAIQTKYGISKERWNLWINGGANRLYPTNRDPVTVENVAQVLISHYGYTLEDARGIAKQIINNLDEYSLATDLPVNKIGDIYDVIDWWDNNRKQAKSSIRQVRVEKLTPEERRAQMKILRNERKELNKKQYSLLGNTFEGLPEGVYLEFAETPADQIRKIVRASFQISDRVYDGLIKELTAQGIKPDKAPMFLLDGLERSRVRGSIVNNLMLNAQDALDETGQVAPEIVKRLKKAAWTIVGREQRASEFDRLLDAAKRKYERTSVTVYRGGKDIELTDNESMYYFPSLGEAAWNARISNWATIRPGAPMYFKGDNPPFGEPFDTYPTPEISEAVIRYNKPFYITDNDLYYREGKFDEAKEAKKQGYDVVIVTDADGRPLQYIPLNPAIVESGVSFAADSKDVRYYRDPTQTKNQATVFEKAKSIAQSIDQLFNQDPESSQYDSDTTFWKLINDVNRWRHGDDRVDIDATRRFLSTLATRVAEFRSQWDEKKGRFTDWARNIQDGATWAANVERGPLTQFYAGGPSSRDLLKAARQFVQYMRAGKKKLTGLEHLQLIKEDINRGFIDRSGNIRSGILKELGQDGYDVVQRMYLAKGSNSLAANMYRQMENEIYKGLSKNELQILEEVINADILMSIFRANPKIAKNFPTPLLSIAAYRDGFHMKRINGLESLRPRQVKAINQKVEAYLRWLKIPLDAMRGKLLSETDYQSAMNWNYPNLDDVPAIAHIFDIEVKREGDRILYESGLQTTGKQKNVTFYEKNSRLIALEIFNRAFGRIMRNEANLALMDMANENPDNGFARIKGTATEIPKDWSPINVYDGGAKRKVWISPLMQQEWITANPELSIRHATLMRAVSGSSVLKTFATGINWGFALANLPRDVMHIWYAARMLQDGKWKGVYSPVAPVYGWQMFMQDLPRVWSDAWHRTGRWNDYVMQGGGMEFLTPQGRLFRRGELKVEDWVDKVQGFLGYLGETSEILTRLAVRDRVIINRAQQQEITYEEANKDSKITQEGTFVARDYMDFSQGGWNAKVMDNFVPYLNASIQGTRGLFRSFTDGTKWESTAKLMQFAALVVGTYVAANKMSPETMKALKHDIQSQSNFIIPLGDHLSYYDKTGQKRYPYLKIPLDPGQRFFKKFFEAATDKWLGNEVDVDGVANAAAQISPATISSIPPTMAGILGYKYNKNFWLDQDIWQSREKPYSWPNSKEEFIPGRTPEMYIDFGAVTGMSPERTKYMVEQLVTTDNIFSMFGGLLYNQFKGLPKSQAEMSFADVLSKTPAIRRYIGSTNPYAQFSEVVRKETEAVDMKMWKQERDVDYVIQRHLYDKNATRQDVVNKIMEVAKGDPDAQNRLFDRLDFSVEVKDIPHRSLWLSMRGKPLEAQANIFIDRLRDATPETRNSIYAEAAKVDAVKGMLSGAFWDKVEEAMYYRKK